MVGESGTVSLVYGRMEEGTNGSLRLTSINFDWLTFYLNSISIDTTLNIQELALDDPSGKNITPDRDKIIIMGMGDRTCTISGSFYIPPGKTPLNHTIAAIIPGRILAGYAVMIHPSSKIKPLELPSGKHWYIDSFSPDRQGARVGKPEFSMVLKYIWEIEGESMIFKWGT